jgi:predicted MFS family arabinose efflux permease
MAGVPSVVSDLRRILAVQGLRAFLYGFGSVLIGSSLAAGGLSAAEVGLIFTAMLAGMAISSIIVGLRGERLGRRRAYVGLLVVMGMAGTALALTRSLPVLVLAALTGTLSTDANESGPITSLEQAMIGEAPAASRIRVFGRYNAIAYLAGAIGALAAGGPELFRAVFPGLPPNQRWLLAFPLVALACALIARSLSPLVEAGGSSPEPATVPTGEKVRALQRSRGTVFKLAALFGLDSFAGGFVVGAFIVFWFERQFRAGTGTMALVIFAAGLIQAASSIVSGRLGARIGLLNTMVFTHLPSNALLLLVPFMPSLPLAIAALLARFALSQMDVPARQAYVVSMVDPAERTAASSFTNTARYITRPWGALAAGTLMSVAAATPFVLAGGLKIVYDGLLWNTFRKVPLPEERVATPRPRRPA